MSKTYAAPRWLADASYCAVRSPRFHARLLGVTVMWWPTTWRRRFQVRRASVASFIVNLGHLEVIVG